jgi:uncharacterized protein DUF4291
LTLNSISQNLPPEKEVRAFYDNSFIRVYQAYSNEIANSALKHKTFVSPPFKMTRMTWIKPSFLWMMYRAGWGFKDSNQQRILAIDLTRDGFLWALNNSCPSSFKPDLFESKEAWEEQKEVSPVRIQWDPERDILLNKLDHRSIQIGLTGEAVLRYSRDWVQEITDVTELAHEIKTLADQGHIERAKDLLPNELPFQLSPELASKIGMSS